MEYSITECHEHWRKCQNLMQIEGVDWLIVSAPVNIYYLLGRIINGLVILPACGDALLFVRRPKGLEGENVYYYRKFDEVQIVLNDIAHSGSSTSSSSVEGRVALELDTLPYNECVRLHALFPTRDLANADSLLRRARAIKTPLEQDLMRQCGSTYVQAFAQIPSLYRLGMSDHEFAIAFEHLLRQMGHIGLFRTFGVKMEAFMGSSVLVGDNADAPSPYDFALGGAGSSSVLPMGDNGTVLKPGQTMMVDGGGCFGPYMTDMTRVFSLGPLPELARQAHACSLAIHDHFRKNVRPGQSCADFYAEALSIVQGASLQAYYMGHQQQASFVGHGVGLQINELPVLFARSKDVFECGMTIALEPKFVIPGVGAVGIENTYIIHNDGVECITPAPEEIIELQ